MNDVAAGLLSRAAYGPAALVIEGDAGIGKTTMLLRLMEGAHEAGFSVVSTRGAQTEVTLTFSALSDLLGDLDPDSIAELPSVQRLALDRVLLRGGDGPSTDERAVAAAFLSVLERQSAVAPVLVAIDDAHWLDSATRTVVAYAARRLAGRVGIVATVRRGDTGDRDANDDVSWLALPRPDMTQRTEIAPLSLGGIHALISARLGHTLSRPVITRIHDLSGGNPLYALELSRAVDRGVGGTEMKLPESLAAVVRDRVDHLGSDARAILLLVATAADPTTELIAKAAGTDTARIVELLEPAESDGVIFYAGNKIRFFHPLLAAGIAGAATAASRRDAHGRLATAETLPELQARHLALSNPAGDPATLQALDVAAMTTRSQGAPATAAELLELAMGLGGDSPMRRMLAANNHFLSGDTRRAQEVLLPAIADLPAGALRATALALLAGICVYTNGFQEATGHLEAALRDIGDNDVLRVHILLMLAFTEINTGRHEQAKQHIESARAVAAELGVDAITSQVLTMAVMVGALSSNGIDFDAQRRALELEDPDSDAPIVFRASANQIQLLAWAGDLDDAQAQLQRVWQASADKGAESELLFLAVHAVLLVLWRGDLTEAIRLAHDAVERAEQLGGDNSLLIASTVQLAAATFAGDVDESRRISRTALAAAARSGPSGVGDWPCRLLGFLEVSQGRYAEALELMDPLIDEFRDGLQCTELLPAHFLPDAIEALVGVGRLVEAEPLVEALEANGVRLDRPWMLAVGGRGRAMLLAATGDLAAAETAAADALQRHDRLPAPFERARTQLLLGQIQRRRRRKQAAVANLTAALDTFDRIGSPLWADRARAELTRMHRAAEVPTGLTRAEQGVAELAAAGLSNKQIAAELFISAKTVETNLSNAYRKLGIRSRAQLFARLRPDARENPDSAEEASQ